MTGKGESVNVTRIWNSDSQLGETEVKDKAKKKDELTRHLTASLGAIQKSRNLTIFKSSPFGNPTPEKEKSKAMQTIEGKLMGAIKVINSPNFNFRI